MVNRATLATVSHAFAFGIVFTIIVLLVAVRARPRFLRNTKVHVAAFDECVFGVTAQLASFHHGSASILGLDALAEIEAVGSDVLFEPRLVDV